MLQTFAEEEDLEALCIFLDFEKAFDRCSWDYLRDAIRNLGFPDETPAGQAPGEEGADAPRHHPFLRWVQLAYSHDHPPTRRMNVNGYLSKAFFIASGVAQGCPLSPLLFLFITEALIRIIQDDTTAHSRSTRAGCCRDPSTLRFRRKKSGVSVIFLNILHVTRLYQCNSHAS